MGTAIVVGGGIAGLYSAILLKNTYEKVYLVEQGEQLGGLLRSFQNEHGDWFDYGTHFITGTEISEVNQVILDNNWTQDWQHFENEKGGNFFNGKLSENCLFVDAKDIGDHYYRGLSEFLEIVDFSGEYANSEQQLEGMFGKTFTREIFIPALCKLFCVDTLVDININAHLRFGMKRLRILNQKATEAIKIVPSYDDRISHHQFIGQAARLQFYPKDGGVGKWVDQFEKKLSEIGVEVICGESVTDIEHENGLIKNISLSDGKKLACDKLVWTVPLVFLFRAAGIACKTQRPTLIHTTLFHYVLDEKPLTDNHFFFCYDPKFLPFRVTLYSNLQPEISDRTQRYRVTVEVLSKEALDKDKMQLSVLEDLKKMGIFSQDIKVLYSHSETIPQGFPVLSHEFTGASKFQYDLAMESFKNISLHGKNNTKDWLMSDVFKSVYEEFGK